MAIIIYKDNIGNLITFLRSGHATMSERYITHGVLYTSQNVSIQLYLSLWFCDCRAVLLSTQSSAANLFLGDMSDSESAALLFERITR